MQDRQAILYQGHVSDPAHPKGGAGRFGCAQPVARLVEAWVSVHTWAEGDGVWMVDTRSFIHMPPRRTL